MGGREAIRAFERFGYVVERVAGSHHVLVKEGQRFHLSVPVHAGKSLTPGVLRSLLKTAGLTTEQFLELL